MDDDLIDPGQPIQVTVIARHSSPIDWMHWETVLGDENPDVEHSPALDPQLQLQAFDCDDRPECKAVRHRTAHARLPRTAQARATS